MKPRLLPDAVNKPALTVSPNESPCAPIQVSTPEVTTAIPRLPCVNAIAPPATETPRSLSCRVKSEAPDAIAAPSVVTVLLSVFETTSKLPTVGSKRPPSVTCTAEPETSTKLSATLEPRPVTFANVQLLICRPTGPLL